MYNNVQPHSALGNKTPAEARRALAQSEGSAPGALARSETDDYQSKDTRYERVTTGGQVTPTKQFLAEGRKMAMIDRDGEALLEEPGRLEDVLPIICDVSRPEQVRP